MVYDFCLPSILSTLSYQLAHYIPTEVIAQFFTKKLMHWRHEQNIKNGHIWLKIWLLNRVLITACLRNFTKCDPISNMRWLRINKNTQSNSIFSDAFSRPHWQFQT
jgi:hypothetical protein